MLNNYYPTISDPLLLVGPRNGDVERPVPLKFISIYYKGAEIYLVFGAELCEHIRNSTWFSEVFV